MGGMGGMGGMGLGMGGEEEGDDEDDGELRTTPNSRHCSRHLIGMKACACTGACYSAIMLRVAANA